MNLKALLSIVALCITATLSSASSSDSAVKLHYGKEIKLTEAATLTLCSNAVRLLETANFNSRQPPDSSLEWSISKTQESYRQTVSGNYLLVSYKEVRRIKTLGGDVAVREIVIGLNRPDLASMLFTIDDEGRIVGYGKYAGPLCSMIMDLVKKIMNDD